MYKYLLLAFLIIMYMATSGGAKEGFTTDNKHNVDMAVAACSKPGKSLTDCYLVQDTVSLTAPITRSHQLLGGTDSYSQVTNNYMSQASNLCDDPVGLGYLQLDEVCFSDF